MRSVSAFEPSYSSVALSERYETLLAAIAQIRASLEYSTLYQTAMTQTQQLFEVDRACLYQVGLAEYVAEALEPGWDSMLGESNGGFEKQVITNISSLEESPQIQQFKRFHIQSALTLPIKQGDRLWGWLCLHQCQASRQWQPLDIAFAQHIASHLATAIQHAEQLRLAQLQEQQHLKTSAQKLEMLVENNPLAVIEWDTQFRVSSWNPAAEAMFGYSQEEALGKHAAELILRDSARLHVDGVFHNLLNQAGGIHNTNENITQSGAIISCEWYNTPLLDEEGNTIAVVSIVQDITARLQAEQERDRFFSHSFDMFCIAGFDGYFQQINPAWERTLGYTAEELYQQPFLEFVHESDRASTIAEAQKTSAGQTTIYFENRYRCKDGSYKWLGWKSVTYVEDAVVYAVARDITEQKSELLQRQQTEAALYESQQKLTTLLSNLPGMAYSCRYEQFCPFLFVSDGCLALTGYHQEDLTGTEISYDGLIHPNDREKVWQTIQEAVEEKRSFQLIYRLHTASGQEKWVLEQGCPIFSTDEQVVSLEGFISDISEQQAALRDRQQAEALLQEQEQFLRSIYDGVEYVLFVIDVSESGTFRYLGWNRACEVSTGISSKQAMGQAPEALFPPEVAAALRWRYEECLRANHSIIFEDYVQVNEGKTYSLVTLNPLRDRSGQIYRIVGTSIDISDRKRLEEERDRFFSISADMLGVAGFDGYFRRINPACETILGYKNDELLTYPFMDFVHPDDRDITLAQFAKISQGIDSSSFENRYRCQDGSYKWLAWNTVTHLPDAVIYASARDITTRKLTEQHLQQQAQREQLLNRIIAQIRNSLDFDTILTTTVEAIYGLLQVDRCTFSWFYPNEEDSYWDLVKDSHRPGLPDTIGRYPTESIKLWSELLFNLEILRIDNIEQIPDPLNRERFQAFGVCSMLVIPVQLRLGVVGVLSCTQNQATRYWKDEEVELLQGVMDQLAIALNQADLYNQSQTKATELAQTLKELQQTQAQLVQTEKMSSLGQLVAGVAHEINNPVSFIYGNLSHASEYTQDLLKLIELYQHYYPQPHPDLKAEAEAIDLDFLITDLPRLITSMKVGAERIRAIVLALRTFSHMDEADLKPVDLHEGIDSTLMILQNRLKETSDLLAVEVVQDYGNLPLIECYSGQLNQVFMNILSNAIDALEGARKRQKNADTSTSPLIRIRTEVVGKQVQIRIADNGGGIRESLRQRIFEPFFTTKPVGKGTGLGLSISYQVIVDKHGGELSCTSSPEQGTEFLVAIPILSAGER